MKCERYCQTRIFEEIDEPANPRKIKLLNPDEYDRIIVSYSGGKDSLACILNLLDMGVPREKMVLWHQRVDGGPNDPPFIDWPATEEYVVATAGALELDLEFQWRAGGYLKELLKENSLKGPVCYTREKETWLLPTTKGKKLSRRRFPAKSNSLKTRWCTGVLKIDVFRRVLNNHPDYKEGKFLVITGERRQESVARSKYLRAEVHPCSNKKRRVDWARAVIEWPEEEVWEIIEKYKVCPHPAYLLGWGRTSCFGCIYSTPDLWAMMREIAPDRFFKLCEMERELNFTIDHERTLSDLADMGMSTIPKNQETSKMVGMALRGGITPENFFVKDWELPAGAFRNQGGPP